MADVIVFGNQFMAEAAVFYLRDAGHSLVAFTVDQAFIKEKTFCGMPVVPFEEIASIYPPDQFKMWLPLGFKNLNKFRAQKYYEAKEKGYQLISYISRNAVIWPGVEIGDNAVICEGVVIQPRAEIGNNVAIAPGALIAHHAVVNDHCFIAAQSVLSGRVRVESYCVLGANSTIRDGVIIARESVIYAGASLNKNTKEGGVYVGNPAKQLRKSARSIMALSSR